MPNGIAPVKQEFILESRLTSLHPRIDNDDAAEEIDYTEPPPCDSGITGRCQSPNHSEFEEPPSKRMKLSGAQRKRLARSKDAGARKAKGMNKNRHFTHISDTIEICWRFVNGEACPGGSSCRFSHDVAAYIEAKPKDLYWPLGTPVFSTAAPFVPEHTFSTSDVAPSIDAKTHCPIFLRFGYCRYGLKCRFLGGHVRAVDPNENSGIPLEVVKMDPPPAPEEINFVDNFTLKQLRSRKFPTPISDAYLRELEQPPKPDPAAAGASQPSPPRLSPSGPGEGLGTSLQQATLAPFSDPPDVPLRACEKKRLFWSGKTHLAPLATVGNLPFRRICIELGADITCSEMALGTSLLSGAKEEWSLVRRHPSERNFGVQLAGAKPALLTKAAEVLTRTLGENGFQYANVNCGCPIDLVFHAGAGSALLDAPAKLGKILMGMNSALGEIPLTIKVRTGVKDGKNTVHKLLPNLQSWGVSSFAIHGRTRQQRYTKLADWDYIKMCAETLRDLAGDNGTPIPIIGGGDVYSARGYYEAIDNYGVDAVMIGRGALIKPWFFTEIQERREWDISSRERLELIRKYAEYGLCHWGSDSQGVNITRRFLCEALSFQHRYIPIGILETMPPLINDRAPPFRGRDELETLLASNCATDWVKISEMFLGPVPEGWTFTPKHKSNAVDNNNG